MVPARRLLAAPDFRRWYLSRSATVAGTAASAVALPPLTYRSTGSALVTSAVAALEALPYLLFGLFAGAAADRLRRKRMMVSADLICALLMLSVPAAHALGRGLAVLVTSPVRRLRIQFAEPTV